MGLWNDSRSPRTEGASSAAPLSHPGEKHPWPGASFAPPWGREGWAWPGCSCVGPREERIKGSHVGPAFISGLQRGANKLCPCARRQQLPPRSLLEAPACFSPPPSCSFPESQQRLISGHPKGAPPLQPHREALLDPGKEGAGTLTPVCVPTVSQPGSQRLIHPCHRISVELSGLKPAVQYGTTHGY